MRVSQLDALKRIDEDTPDRQRLVRHFMKTVWKVSNPTLRRSMRPIPIGVHSSLGQLARGENHEM